VETLVDAPKQEEHKLNLHLTGFEAKEGETEKELVHRLNTELLQGQMRLRTKVVVTTRQRLATTWTSASAMGARLSAMLLKFATSEDRQATLQGHKAIAGTKLALDNDFMHAQQVHKSKLWLLFKKAKAASKHAF
jgi:hypothetical protein